MEEMFVLMSICSGLSAAEYCTVQEAVERGVEHARDEEFGSARQCYKQALEIFPDNVDALVALGAAYANQKNFKEALSCFSKALGE